VILLLSFTIAFSYNQLSEKRISFLEKNADHIEKIYYKGFYVNTIGGYFTIGVNN